jgi:hypothetical protein
MDILCPPLTLKKVPGMIYDMKIKYKIDFYQKVAINSLHRNDVKFLPINSLLSSIGGAEQQ